MTLWSSYAALLDIKTLHPNCHIVANDMRIALITVALISFFPRNNKGHTDLCCTFPGKLFWCSTNKLFCVFLNKSFFFSSGVSVEQCFSFPSFTYLFLINICVLLLWTCACVVNRLYLMRAPVSFINRNGMADIEIANAWIIYWNTPFHAAWFTVDLMIHVLNSSVKFISRLTVCSGT